MLAENVTELQGARTDVQMAEGSGVSYKVFSRIKAKGNTSIDTLSAVAKALDVPPYLLLMKGAAQSYMRKVFSTPIPDQRLGAAWTRPDRRKPLLVSERPAKYSTRTAKIKTTR